MQAMPVPVTEDERRIIVALLEADQPLDAIALASKVDGLSVKAALKALRRLETVELVNPVGVLPVYERYVVSR